MSLCKMNAKSKAILEMLEKTDIDTISPLEALLKLNEVLSVEEVDPLTRLRYNTFSISIQRPGTLNLYGSKFQLGYFKLKIFFSKFNYPKTPSL